MNVIPSRLAALGGLLALTVVAPRHASGQAQVAWDQSASAAYTADPAQAIAFGLNGESVLVGTYKLSSFYSERSAWFVLRGADGSMIASNHWPNPVPSGGIFEWKGAAFGPTGEIALVGSGSNGGIVALCNPNGQFSWGPLAWQAQYGRALSVCFDSAGNIVTAGQHGADDLHIVRYSPTGAPLASTTWVDPANGGTVPTQITTDVQGNTYVVGLADPYGAQRLCVLKFDPALNVTWERELISAQAMSPGPRLVVDSTGHVVVACGAPGPSGGMRFTLWNLAPSGTTAWIAQPADVAHPGGLALSVAIDPWGRFVVGGSWGGASDALLQSYDSSGVLLWSRSAGVTSSWFESLAVDAGGDVVAAGWSGLPRRALSARYSSHGERRYLYSDPVWIGSAASTAGIGVAPDGGAIVACDAMLSGQLMSFRSYRLDTAVFPVCTGDGSAGACPCGNSSPSAERSGCQSSIGSGGRLDVLGEASLSADALILVGSGMPNSTVLYFQGSTIVPAVAFGDGLRCTGGSLVRLATRSNSNGGSQYPGVFDPTLSVAGVIGAPQTVWYQAWYRNAAQFCTSATYNLTNGLRASWVP